MSVLYPREEEFWAFVAERHAIYRRRFEEKRPPPWTADPVLASGHFTNVYRELDPGTVYIRDELRRHVEASHAERILNVWLYRFALREESWDVLGWRSLAGFDGAAWGAELGALREEWRARGLGSPYHSAYYINNYGNRPIPKHEAIGLMAAKTTEALLGEPGRMLEVAADRREWLELAVEHLTGFGDFLANQVLADLTYEGEGHSTLPEEGYVLLGTGARRGLRVVVGLPENSTDLGEIALREILDRLWERQRPPGKRLTRMNLQNCCCEFSKWSRARATEGRGGTRRRFDPAEAWERTNGAAQGGLGL